MAWSEGTRQTRPSLGWFGGLVCGGLSNYPHSNPNHPNPIIHLIDVPLTQTRCRFSRTNGPVPPFRADLSGFVFICQPSDELCGKEAPVYGRGPARDGAMSRLVRLLSPGGNGLLHRSRAALAAREEGTASPELDGEGEGTPTLHSAAQFRP